MKDGPLSTLQQVFPFELQRHSAVFELAFDDNSRLTFSSLQAGGFAVQIWRSGQARDGHGYLLASSAFLDEGDVDQLVDSLVLRRRVA